MVRGSNLALLGTHEYSQSSVVISPDDTPKEQRMQTIKVTSDDEGQTVYINVDKIVTFCQQKKRTFINADPVGLWCKESVEDIQRQIDELNKPTVWTQRTYGGTADIRLDRPVPIAPPPPLDPPGIWDSQRPTSTGHQTSRSLEDVAPWTKAQDEP